MVNLSKPLIVCLLAALCVGMTHAAEIDWQVVSSGAISSQSASYSINATIGQPFIGRVESSGFDITAGFWQILPTTCCLMRGDIDDNGWVDIADIVYMVDYFWNGAIEPGCSFEVDVDGSGIVDPLDLTYLVNAYWKDGPSPAACP
ncbi:MAG: hypothetical protein AB1483_09160 [Candidatus Zixiibacteriota bacterium]